jgi:thiol-disulfide isomerase/thioredoxin
MRPFLAVLMTAVLLEAGAAVTSVRAADRSATNAGASTLEGAPAPRIEGRLHIGPRVPTLNELTGKVVLLFFWAHWCSVCREESATIENVLNRYRSQGLVLIAPTQRYGVVEEGRPAPPDKELRHIIQVRDAHYAFLRTEPVPISEGNHKAYRADTVPLNVLIDRQGIVRAYRPGLMTEEELDAAVRGLLTP